MLQTGARAGRGGGRGGGQFGFQLDEDGGRSTGPALMLTLTPASL